MSFSAVQAVKESSLPPRDRLVAIVLADYLNDTTGQCNPSIPRLASDTGLNWRTVMRILSRLRDAGHISIITDSGKRSNYKVHPLKTVSVNPLIPLSHSDTPVIAVTPLSFQTQTPVIPDTPNITIMNNIPATPKPRQKTKRASEADPRHHAITDQIGKVYRDVTGDAMAFPDAFGPALKRFLKGWPKEKTADDWLDRYDEVLKNRDVLFAALCKKASDPCFLCRNWLSVEAELQGLRKPAFTSKPFKNAV